MVVSGQELSTRHAATHSPDQVPVAIPSDERLGASGGVVGSVADLQRTQDQRFHQQAYEAVQAGADLNSLFGDAIATAQESTLQAHATGCECGACGTQMEQQNASSSETATIATEQASTSDAAQASALLSSPTREVSTSSSATTNQTDQLSTGPDSLEGLFGDAIATAQESTLQAHATGCECGACGTQMEQQNASSSEQAKVAAERATGTDAEKGSNLLSIQVEKGAAHSMLDPRENVRPSLQASRDEGILTASRETHHTRPDGIVRVARSQETTPNHASSGAISSSVSSFSLARSSHAVSPGLSADRAVPRGTYRPQNPVNAARNIDQTIQTKASESPRRNSAPFSASAEQRIGRLSLQTQKVDVRWTRSMTSSPVREVSPHLNRHLRPARPLEDRTQTLQRTLALDRRSSLRSVEDRRDIRLNSERARTAADKPALRKGGVTYSSRRLGENVVLETNSKNGGSFRQITQALQKRIEILIAQNRDRIADLQSRFSKRLEASSPVRLRIPEAQQVREVRNLLNRLVPKTMTPFTVKEVQTLLALIKGGKTPKEIVAILRRSSSSHSHSQSIKQKIVPQDPRGGTAHRHILPVRVKSDAPESSRVVLRSLRAALERKSAMSRSGTDRSEQSAKLQNRRAESLAERIVARKTLRLLSESSPQEKREVLRALIRAQNSDQLRRIQNFRNSTRSQLQRLKAKERILEKGLDTIERKASKGVSSLPQSRRERVKLITDLIAGVEKNSRGSLHERTNTPRTAPLRSTDGGVSPKEKSLSSSPRSEQQVAELIQDLITYNARKSSKRTVKKSTDPRGLRKFSTFDDLLKDFRFETDEAIDQNEATLSESQTEVRRAFKGEDDTDFAPQIMQILELGSAIGGGGSELSVAASGGAAGVPLLKKRSGAKQSLDHFQSEVGDSGEDDDLLSDVEVA